MRYRRSDVVDRALRVLDDYGLADLTMRRLGAELGVQPSALYHHFANKQSLLAGVADELLARGPSAARPDAWDLRILAICSDLREALLAYRDGAEVVATVRAFGLGAAAPYDDLLSALDDGAVPAELVPVAARTLLHFVLGHVGDEQTQLQAAAAGAIDGEVLTTSDFAAGLGLIVDGIRAAVRTRASTSCGPAHRHAPVARAAGE